MFDKYISLLDRKTRAESLSLARLRTPGGSIPIVAAAEPDSILVHWWDDGGGDPSLASWRNWEREHGAWRDTDLEMERRGWSQRIGLAGGDGVVYLVYKRRIRRERRRAPRLYVDELGWDAAARTLIPRRTRPAAIDLAGLGYQAAGSSLWSIYDFKYDSLVVVAQLIRPDDSLVLALLVADLSQGSVRLGSASSWRVHEIGVGGFDLDVLPNGSNLCCVYREERFTSVIDHPSIEPVVDGTTRVAFLSAGGAQVGFAPLTIAFVEIASGTVSRTLRDVPGGEHPQILSAEPLLLSSDRPEFRAVTTFQPRPNGQPGLSIFELGGCRKVLQMLAADGSWSSGTLLEWHGDFWPRRPIDAPAPPGFNLAPRDRYRERVLARVEAGRASFAFAYARRPIHRLSFEYIPEKDLIRIDLAFQWTYYDALLSARFELQRQGSSISVQSQGYRVLDINHDQLAPVGDGRPRLIENRQFEALRHRFGIAPDTTPIDQYTDNGIGGALAVDAGGDQPALITYTDMADGGIRAIGFAPSPMPAPVLDPKFMEPGAVTGPGAAGDVWIELSHPPDAWLDASLPALPFLPSEKRFTLGTGLEETIDRIAGVVSLAPGDLPDAMVNGALVLDPLTIEIIVGLAADQFPDGPDPVWDALWDPVERLAGENEHVALFDTSIRIAKYELSYVYSPDNGGVRQRSTVTVRVAPDYGTALRFHGRSNGQGQIAYRFDIRFVSSDVQVTSFLAAFTTVDSVAVRLHYERRYTPAVLMTDQRTIRASDQQRRDRPIETTRSADPGRFGPACLAARPASHARTSVAEVQIGLSMNALAQIGLAAVLGFLTVLGLIVLFPPVVIAGPTLWIVLGIVWYFLVPSIVTALVRSAVRGGLENSADDITRALSGSGLSFYAGEGLAEALARKALQEAGESIDPAVSSAENRHRPQFWQMIFVAENRCRILIRRP